MVIVSGPKICLTVLLVIVKPNISPYCSLQPRNAVTWRLGEKSSRTSASASPALVAASAQTDTGSAHCSLGLWAGPGVSGCPGLGVGWGGKQPGSGAGGRSPSNLAWRVSASPARWLGIVSKVLPKQQTLPERALENTVKNKKRKERNQDPGVSYFKKLSNLCFWG